MLVWWLTLFVGAEPLNPLSISLDREIEDQVLLQLQSLEVQQVDEVLESFEETVFPSARVRYELGLQYYQTNNVSAAEVQYQEALKIDSEYGPALYDLAEILLMRGEISLAKQHFMTLQQQVHQHWAISYRLAQISAGERQTKQMELYLKRALREGMPSQILIDDKVQWQSYLQQPTVALSMEFLLSALGHDSIWKELRPVSK